MRLRTHSRLCTTKALSSIRHLLAHLLAMQAHFTYLRRPLHWASKVSVEATVSYLTSFLQLMFFAYSYFPILDDARNIDVSILLNTGVVGGVIVRVNLRLPTDIPFADFFNRVCARMDLDPLDAKLGYKYGSDRVRDPPNQLSNEEELRVAMEKGRNKLRLARTQEVILEIHNLVCQFFNLMNDTLLTHANQNPARSAAQGAQKRSAAESSAVVDGTEPDTAVSFKTELRELKQRLQCEKHSGKYCYVDPINPGEHIALDIYKLTLWAKKIVSSIIIL